jgi:hypothetical protein
MKRIKKFGEFINESWKMSPEAKELNDYFEEYDVKITKKFDYKECLSTLASTWNYTEKQIETMLFNLEDSSVMQDIADGDYESFDPSDSSQFNDSYEDMMDEI